LIEMLAVVIVMALVLIGATTMYRDLLANSTTAADRTTQTRRTTLLLDRIARDLEGAVLIQKPGEVDPLAHPWLFLAEARPGDTGATRLKFDTRSGRAAGAHASDLAVVAYWVEAGEAEDLVLLRWSSPTLPESLDRAFPRGDDEGAQVVAEGIEHFGVTFTDETGAETKAWDSSTLAQSSQLPLAAEIELALIDPARPEDAEPRVWTRRVLLPLRPLDLAKALSGEADDEAEDEEDDAEDGDDVCTTVAQCIALNPGPYAAFLAVQPDPAAFQAAVDSVREQCWADVGPSLGIDLGNCE
jgi:type II secretory pathway component PulJ